MQIQNRKLLIAAEFASIATSVNLQFALINLRFAISRRYRSCTASPSRVANSKQTTRSVPRMINFFPTTIGADQQG